MISVNYKVFCIGHIYKMHCYILRIVDLFSILIANSCKDESNYYRISYVFVCCENVKFICYSCAIIVHVLISTCFASNNPFDFKKEQRIKSMRVYSS